MMDEDKWYARRLPDDFIIHSGDAPSRISQVVRENWWGHDTEAQSKLVRALVPVLRELLQPGVKVTDEHRDVCEGIVYTWLAQV